MKPLKFPEHDTVFAENQPEYVPLPAFTGDVHSNPKGEVIFCMGLSFRERLRVFITGKIWCSLMMFRDIKTKRINPLTPSFLTTKKSDVLIGPETN